MRNIVLCGLAGLIGCAVMPTGLVAQSKCDFYKVTAPALDVSKDAKNPLGNAGVLVSGEMACVTKEQTIAGRQWGFVQYKMLEDGQLKPVSGWASLRYMTAQGKPSEYTTASAEPAPAPVQAAPTAVAAPAPVPVAAPPQQAATTAAPKIVAPALATAPAPAPAAAPSPVATDAKRAESEKAYKATAAIGTCGAYKLFVEQYRSTFYGQLADQYLKANCLDKDGKIKVAAATPQVAAGTPGGAPAGMAPAAGAAGATPALFSRNLAPDLQTALQGIGCYSGGIDGDWGRGSQGAMDRFNALAGTRYTSSNPTDEALDAVLAWRGGNCATVVRSKPRKKVYAKKKVYKKKKKSTSTATKKKPGGGGGGFTIILGGGGGGLGIGF